MTTEAQKKSRNKWDAENMTVLGCKVRKSIADDFKAACKAVGTSPNEIFRHALEDFMRDPKKPEKQPENP